MRDRVKTLKRVLQVQKKLHALEELKYVRLKQKVQQCQDDQRDLTNSLSSEDALHGLFLDMTVRRVQALRLEEARLAPLIEAQQRVLSEHGARLSNSERLSAELGEELKRTDERLELERLLEAGFAQSGASSEQDR
ncbi:hypothetical protein W911_03975 [Hyphomicrobium nitrativorans NL23]|uniref:Flagellar FliJ protein n=1 Tax=Hyphomicrobium nitrativorans NL23 TaxID=1029756 RepID=V5SGC6_9HYPH|nr:hypothetical protein [Hyphomicrobium nitrativorans]AHB49916.1 hypothetical protein W911_03975 [Hyphomicrobium nitrativorans NL23]